MNNEDSTNTPKVKLKWYEQVWIAWPIIMVVFGGAIGGGCGGVAWAINSKVFAKTKHHILRYVWTGLISVGSVIAWIILSALFVLALVQLGS